MDKNGTKIILFLPASSGSFYVVPAKVLTVNEFAFSGCNKLQRVIIPDGNIESIGVSAFEGCTKLKFLYLPRSLKEIGANAFNGCNSLRCGGVVINEELKKSAIEDGKIPEDALRSNCVQHVFSCGHKQTASNSLMNSVFLFVIYSSV